MTSVAVTGANGFVGRAVCEAACAAGHDVRALVRPAREAGVRAAVSTTVVTAMTDPVAWAAALHGRAVVVHLIGRTHVLRDRAVDVEATYRAVNVDVTRAVVDGAACAGVQRVIYVSSIKAVGEGAGTPYDEDATCRPADAYGRTKLAAERLLDEESRVETVVLRPPLVYGPGVVGNFRRLLQAVDRGWPIPIAVPSPARSVVYVDNLADAVVAVIDAPPARDEVFHVADDVSPTVAQLVAGLGVALGRRPRTVPMPVVLLRVVAGALGRADVVRRLADPLTVSTAKLRRVLGWQPRWAFDDALAATVRAYRAGDTAG